MHRLPIYRGLNGPDRALIASLVGMDKYRHPRTQSSQCMIQPMAITRPFHGQAIHRYTAHHLVRWLGLHDHLVLLALAIIALGTYGFVKLMAEVRGENTAQFDERVMRYVGAHRGSLEMEEIGRDVTPWVASPSFRW